VRRAICEGKRNKATGYDNITYEMLRKIPNNAVKVLQNCYKKIAVKGISPSAWKHSRPIVPSVIKQGNKSPTDSASYRPISLTSTFCKILEKMVATRLVFHLEKHNVLCAEPSGFRVRRSAIDQLRPMRLHNVFMIKVTLLGFFIDFASAFDMVWQKGLLIKMKDRAYGHNRKYFRFC